MSKTALLLLYPQNEEMEICIPVAVLRRGGIKVTIAGPDKNPVVGSRGMKILPETSLKEAMTKGPYDVIVIAGGALGWKALSEDPDVGVVLREQEKCGRLIASICTSPIAMKKHGVMYGKRLTSYPTVEDRVREGDKYIYKYDDVVIDGNLISSRGNYTSYHWALAVVERLTDRANAIETAREMLITY